VPNSEDDILAVLFLDGWIKHAEVSGIKIL
jgi:hypothetical protein